MVLLSLIGIALWCWRHSTRVNQIIDIDQRTHQTASFQIDLNHATWMEISNLPGIGDQCAKEVVAYREQIGSFASIQDIQDVDGIGPRTFEQIAPFLALVSGESAWKNHDKTSASRIASTR